MEFRKVAWPLPGLWLREQWKNAGQVKDYSITGEWFELKECPVCHLKTTYPHPKETEIGRYYASEDYVSHSDTQAGLINRLYHTAGITC